MVVFALAKIFELSRFLLFWVSIVLTEYFISWIVERLITVGAEKGAIVDAVNLSDFWL